MIYLKIANLCAMAIISLLCGAICMLLVLEFVPISFQQRAPALAGPVAGLSFVIGSLIGYSCFLIIHKCAVKIRCAWKGLV